MCYNEHMKKDWLPIESAPKYHERKADRIVHVLVTRLPFDGAPPCNLVWWGVPKDGGPKTWVLEGKKPLRYVPTHWHPIPSFD